MIENQVWAATTARRLADEGDNDNARIGAVRTVAAVSERLVKLLALVGLTPQPDQVLIARALRKRVREEATEQGERMLVGGEA